MYLGLRNQPAVFNLDHGTLLGLRVQSSNPNLFPHIIMYQEAALQQDLPGISSLLIRTRGRRRIELYEAGRILDINSVWNKRRVMEVIEQCYEGILQPSTSNSKPSIKHNKNLVVEYEYCLLMQLRYDAVEGLQNHHHLPL